MWTQDWSEAKRLARKCAEAYVSLFSSLSCPQPGVVEWLHALQRNQVPCGVVSNMSRSTVRSVLSRMAITDFFIADVCFEDGMDTLAQSYLSASMKLQRPPNQCVVFTNSPKVGHTATLVESKLDTGVSSCYASQIFFIFKLARFMWPYVQGIAAAHNCTMKTVAMLGDYKGYQLKQADLTCAHMDQLSVYNLRRLFANRGGEFMDTRKEKNGTTKASSITRIASEGRS